MKNRDIFVITLVILFILAFPFLMAALQGGKLFVFTGFLLNPIDGASYLAKMYEGWSGNWQFTLPFTAEVGNGAYLFLFYIILGHLARWVHLPLLLVFHLARLVCSLFFLYTIFIFYKRLFPTRPDLLRSAYVLTALGAGMGWLLVFGGKIPFDFWVAEAYPFLSMYSNPHFPAGMGLLLLSIVTMLDAPSKKRNGILLCSGLLISIIYPFGLVLMLMLAGGWLAWKWFTERCFDWVPLISIGLLGGPFLLYQFLVAQQDPFFSGWNQQNLTLTPNAGDVLLSLSPVLFFALPGGFWLLRQKNHPEKPFLLLWPFFGLLLAYLPISLQRRFTFGIFLPLVVLCIYGIDILRKQYPGLARRVIVLVIAFSLPTNILLISSALLAASSHPSMLYLTHDEAQALAWIDSELPKNAVILASPEISLFIPGLNGRRVVYAHPFETVHAVEKEQGVLRFFQDPSWTEEKVSFLAENRVDYLVYGPRERLIGKNLDVSHLTLIHQIGSINIYTVPQSP